LPCKKTDKVPGMQCEQARQLFDAYLDGELSPALATELGAHRVHCSDCRRALALMEVSGHVIASDREAVNLPVDFSDRLLACMDAPHHRRAARLRYAMYFSGPLVAAAVIVMAFLGVFDRKSTTVAGREEKMKGKLAPALQQPSTTAPQDPTTQARIEAEYSLEQLFGQWEKNYETKRQSGESLQQQLDLTIGQWLDILEEAKDTSSPVDHFPGADATGEDSNNDPDPTDPPGIAD